jgi:hypothetical protein
MERYGPRAILAAGRQTLTYSSSPAENPFDGREVVHEVTYGEKSAPIKERVNSNWLLPRRRGRSSLAVLRGHAKRAGQANDLPN